MDTDTQGSEEFKYINYSFRKNLSTASEPTFSAFCKLLKRINYWNYWILENRTKLWFALFVNTIRNSVHYPDLLKRKIKYVHEGYCYLNTCLFNEYSKSIFLKVKPHMEKYTNCRSTFTWKNIFFLQYL